MLQGSSASKKELENLAKKLSSPKQFSSASQLQDASKRYAQLRKLFDVQGQIDVLEKHIQENQTMLEQEQDSELKGLALEELNENEKKKKELQAQIEAIQSGEDGGQKTNDVIMEIRPGVGGEEAALFAQNLLRMYGRYAERNDWEFSILEKNVTELGGIKEVVCEIKGNQVMKKLQYESGVHRIQRIPETEKSGRIHTSTASVAVLPKARPVDLEIRPEDIRVDVFRSSGPGGQAVNKISSAARITHIPSGMVVSSQTSRSQQENKEIAMTILRTRLLQMKRDKEEKEIGETRRKQIGGAWRSEKIRTYNIPQDRVTDHRINKNWHKIETIFDGNLDHIIETLITEEKNRGEQQK